MTPNNFREKANLRLAGSGRYTSCVGRVQGARVRVYDPAVCGAAPKDEVIKQFYEFQDFLDEERLTPNLNGLGRE